MSTYYPDFITIIGNFSQSMYALQYLFSGLAYVIAALFIIKGFEKMKEILEKGRMGGGGEHFFGPLAYILGGACLIYLPSVTKIAANTSFGVGNILSYAKYNPYDVISAMTIIIRTAGLIWFIRGAVLLVHASAPGFQHGKKGLFFLCAGIIAMNFETSVSYVDWVVEKISTTTLTPGLTSR